MLKYNRQQKPGKWRTIPLAGLFLLCAQLLTAEPSYTIDPQSSTVTVFVPRAGLLRVMGHDHNIISEQIAGEIRFKTGNNSPEMLEVRIPVSSLKVVDSGVSEDTRKKIENTMKGTEVLDHGSAPVINYRASQIQVLSSGKWLVTGQLTIRNKTKPVSFEADVVFTDQNTLQAKSSFELKPALFGIEPVKALGGAIKTASVITIGFEVTASKQAN